MWPPVASFFSGLSVACSLISIRNWVRKLKCLNREKNPIEIRFLHERIPVVTLEDLFETLLKRITERLDKPIR
jgi:hypothetical protein